VQINNNREMKNSPNYKFIDQIQDLIILYELNQIESRLSTIQKEYRKSFLIMVFAGYSVNAALKNYKNFYRFVESNLLSYSQGIKMITKIAKAETDGMVINDLTVYELN
jgi:hypothetical protein